MTTTDEQSNTIYDPQIRELNALALSWVERHVSPQTTYLHFNYHHSAGEGYQTIPTLENLLYAYALFKSKTAESIGEAKRILKGMLQFQNNADSITQGNFPVYLHEYPLCKDRQHGVHLLPILYWIMAQFRQVLGSELERELRQRTAALLEYCRKSHREKEMPSSVAIKLAAALYVFGNLNNDCGMKEEGELLLKRLCLESEEWFSPLYLSDFLIAMQMTDSAKTAHLWDPLRQFLANSYHRQTASYVGPVFYEFQWKNAPQTTPYNFYMAYFSGALPKRLLNPDVPSLYACLIQPSSRTLGEDGTVSLNGVCEGRPWQFKKQQEMAYSLIDAKGNKLDALWKGLIPFKMTWGSDADVHTLVAQGGNYEQISTTPTGNALVLEYQLAKEFDLEDKERRREVILAVDRGEKILLRVNGTPATTFTLNDRVEIVSGTFKIELEFLLAQGEGQFLGHLMPGNRASQLALKNEERYNAYDTLIFLRTLRRGPDCHIHVKITYYNT